MMGLSRATEVDELREVWSTINMDWGVILLVSWWSPRDVENDELNDR